MVPNLTTFGLDIGKGIYDSCYPRQIFFQKFSFELIKLLSLCWRPEVVQSHVSWVEMYKAVLDTVVRISRMEERELKPST